MDLLEKLDEHGITPFFLYAPTGLGHIRVARALSEALYPRDPEFLFAGSSWYQRVHKLTSRIGLLQAILEYSQTERIEEYYAQIFRWYAQFTNRELYTAIARYIRDKKQIKVLLIICSFPTLAIQAVELRKKIESIFGITVRIALQITDDSPQTIWYVPGVDMIHVPSFETKERLLDYAKRWKLPIAPLVVGPYPLSPALSKLLPISRTSIIESEMNKIKIAIPISGASVGRKFLGQLIKSLLIGSKQWELHVVGRVTPGTLSWLTTFENSTNVKSHLGAHDNDAIDAYDELYRHHIITAEVTKPSEHAFKALLSSDKRGGVALFFAPPVGRQEYDNLTSLRRHNVLPEQSIQQKFWQCTLQRSDGRLTNNLLQVLENHSWRAMLLPQNGKDAGLFMSNALTNGIFRSLIRTPHSVVVDQMNEIDPGVNSFWVNILNRI